MYKISVIMPAYNSENTIERAIKSIINQTFKEWELIIVNDGSTDNTKKICEQYNNDERIKIVNINNGGPSRARNIALEKATGIYVMFLDSDDSYEKGMMEIMYKNIHDIPFDLVCCSNYYIGKDNIRQNNIERKECKQKDKLYEIINYLQEKRKFNPIWNKIYNNDIIKKNKLKFNEEINWGEDYRFNIDYCSVINSIKVIDNNLYNYTRDSFSSITNCYKKDEFEVETENIKYNEEMYKKNDYPIQHLYNKYIKNIITSTMLINSKASNLNKSEKLNRIESIINNPNVQEAINNVIPNNFEERIYCDAIKQKDVNKVYFYSKIRSLIKKFINK